MEKLEETSNGGLFQRVTLLLTSLPAVVDLVVLNRGELMKKMLEHAASTLSRLSSHTISRAFEVRFSTHQTHKDGAPFVEMNFELGMIQSRSQGPTIRPWRSRTKVYVLIS
ncbi:hypothetical protein AVEN_69824-1 [Araneus ventricosus]|uniref:Uncharacterized protein n=1 Tax=Araneus ventricosus TaxID=182803 RepID=A0A4Y2Q5F5_ARAVE|nr:hypothetical protein AVEN_250449-1 [Araneus ventricosus]GBN58692.1 hypothetical protein AVEN_69824-1 [Araneus ventricosus]